MVVPPVHQPDFVRHARRVRAQRIVISLHVHDALPLLLLLTHGVTENAALFILKPFVRGAEFVFDSPWHKNRRRQLRRRMCPHSSPASAPWFLNTVTYLNRASFFKSAIRDAHTHNTRSISSSLNCDIRLSCSGVSTTTSCAPSAPILSYIPSARRAGSPST